MQVDPNPGRSYEQAKQDIARQYGIEDILTANSRIPFVRRILFPDQAPVTVDTEDSERRRVMTHKMEYSTADGKAYVYPRVMLDENGVLRDYGDMAFDEAIKRRDFITFNSPEQADWFTRNYKSYWDKIGFVPKVRQ